ncbi:MAG TPA: hypothetical protein VFQ45_07815 [Longimicrobium sp.]|nr:hypothetical protein [Longimicrobium sp.]
MMLQRDFWTRLVAWMAVLLASTTLVLVALGAGAADGWRRDLPRVAATLVPIAAFLAGTGAGARAADAPRGDAAVRGALAVLLVGVLAAGLNLAATAAESGSGLLARAQLRQEYTAAVERAVAHPEFSAVGWSAPWARAHTLGWEYHYQLAGAAVAVLMAAAGLLLGAWLSLHGRGPRRSRVVWVAAAGAGAWLLGSVVLGLELSQQSRVAPALTAWAVALLPAAAVLCLAGPVLALARRRPTGPA